MKSVYQLLFLGIIAIMLSMCNTSKKNDTVDVLPLDSTGQNIVINYEFGEGLSPAKYKNIYAIWIEDEATGTIQNISISKKIIAGGLTGTAVPFWKINKYPKSSKTEIDAVTSATQANTDFSVSAMLKDDSLKKFKVYFEVDRAYEPNDWFKDQPAILYSANIDLDSNITNYELLPIGWTPNEYTKDFIPNTPMGQLQTEMRYITNLKEGSSFGAEDARSLTKMTKKITLEIK